MRLLSCGVDHIGEAKALLDAAAQILLATGCLGVVAGIAAWLRGHEGVSVLGVFRALLAFFLFIGARELVSLAGAFVGPPEALATARALLGLLAGLSICGAALMLWRAMPRISTLPTSSAADAQQREIAALNEALEARLESLSTLAGGVAHDFNNLLTVITGHADLMASGDKSPSRAEHLASIRTAADRAAGLSRQMLAFSGRGHFLREPMRLRDCIDVQTLGDVPDITFEFELGDDLPPLQLAPKEIRQLVDELVRNAIEATVEGGVMDPQVSVRIRRAALDADALANARLEHELEAGEFVLLEVEDNGAGMVEEVTDRLFEPYFSTRFGGRGLGMAAVAGIVRGHDATLFVTTTPGSGTCVCVAFAVTTADGPDFRAPSQSGPVRRLLVLDDETSLLELAKEYAHQLGMEAVVTDDPDEAIEILLTEGAGIDAVLLDYLMPLRTGDEVLAEIREFSAVDVYLTSGFSRGRVDDPVLRRELAGFLQKPFTFEDFRRLLAPE